MSFTYGLLAEARNKSLAADMASVIAAAIPSDTRPTRSSLDSTPLIAGLFLESLRLFPLAAALGGECTQDLDFTYDGVNYSLPAGTNVFFYNMVMQRDPHLAGSDPDTVQKDGRCHSMSSHSLVPSTRVSTCVLASPSP